MTFCQGLWKYCVVGCIYSPSLPEHGSHPVDMCGFGGKGGGHEQSVDSSSLTMNLLHVPYSGRIQVDTERARGVGLWWAQVVVVGLQWTWVEEFRVRGVSVGVCECVYVYVWRRRREGRFRKGLHNLLLQSARN